MFIDTHCHLTFPEFDTDRNTVIGNAKKAGVKQFIIPGASLESSRKAVAFVRNQKSHSCFATVGIHPYETKNFPDVRLLEPMIGPSVVAIGECGLDYHAYEGYPAVGKKEEQKQLFEEQLLVALKHNLPVIIHSREAFMDIFDVIDSLPSLPKGVFHCFSGGPEDLKQILKRGFSVGIDGNVTYSKQLAIVVPLIPIERLLIETDAPYLPPVPHRGERNEPKHIPLIAKKIADLKWIEASAIEAQTTANAKALFGI